MISATATSCASGKLVIACACMRPITPQPIIPNRSFSVILDVSLIFMLLLLPTQMGCYFGKKAVKKLNRVVYGTTYDQQKARASLFHHRLPRAHRFSAYERIFIDTK